MRRKRCVCKAHFLGGGESGISHPVSEPADREHVGAKMPVTLATASHMGATCSSPSCFASNLAPS